MGQWDCTRREKQQYNNDIQRSHCFVTYSLPWRMHRYYTRNRDSKPSRKFTRFQQRNVIGFLPNYKQSCNASARGIAGTVPRFKSFAKLSFNSTLFRSRDTRENVSQFRFLFAFVWFIHARICFYHWIERKSYWYTEFIYRILLYFYQCCNKPIDLLIFPRQEWFDVKKCQRWKKFINHRHFVFFFFFFIMSNRILGELTAKAERYFTKNNRVKCKFTKRDAL